MTNSALDAHFEAIVERAVERVLERRGAQAPIAAAPVLSTVDETARALNCSRAKLYALVKAGAIPVVRVGETMRFDLFTVIEALKGAPPPKNDGGAVVPLSRPRRRAG
jgi:excisionase family DNA binding protein